MLISETSLPTSPVFSAFGATMEPTIRLPSTPMEALACRLSSAAGAAHARFSRSLRARSRIVVLRCGEPPPYWNLPGGTLEAGETAVEALVREVAEEACARVLGWRYLGCQEIIGERPAPHYQTRFWARVELDPWEPRFEKGGRPPGRPR